MEAVIDQALGDILRRRRFESAQIDDAFMGHESVSSFEKNRKKLSSRRAI
jgi:hypothetical protein